MEDVIKNLVDRLDKSCSQVFSVHMQEYVNTVNHANSDLRNMVLTWQNTVTKHIQDANKEYNKFCQIQKIKYYGLLLSVIISPIAIILYFLEALGIINFLK